MENRNEIDNGAELHEAEALMGIAAPIVTNPMSEDAMRFIYELGCKNRDYTVREINGGIYVNTNGLTLVQKYERPAPDLFTSYTLTGLVEYLKNDVDGHFRACDFVHVVVEGVNTVSVYAPIRGEKNQRHKLATCRFERPNVALNQYVDQELFSVMVQTHFDDGDNRKKVLQIAGNLRMEENANLADDGVTQVVTLKSGISRVEDAPVVNPVMLAPHRTFPEIDQPSSPFILRIRKGGGDGAQLALFEADGGAWKIEAVSRVGAWLREQLMDVCAVVIA